MPNNTFKHYWQIYQNGIFPMFEEMLSPSTDTHWSVIAALDVIKIEDCIDTTRYSDRLGRPKIDRDKFARAFIAKAVLNISATNMLIDRLKVDKVLRRICGWVFEKLPCEASFSNAFSEFANIGLLDKVHEKIIKENLANDLVFHISRDSTAIEARESVKQEKIEAKNSKPKTKKAKRGRPKSGEIRAPKPQTKLEQQYGKSLEEMLEFVSTDCDFGCKKNSNGKINTWKGYKLHIDSADGGLPVSCFLSSASVHDSSLALPLEAKTNARVISLYTLADAAYDAAIIRNDIISYGKVGIIDKNIRRSTEVIKMTSVEKARFRNRTTAERVNASLKDRFGARMILVKGSKKVLCHLMFGVLALTAEALLNLAK